MAGLRGFAEQIGVPFPQLAHGHLLHDRDLCLDVQRPARSAGAFRRTSGASRISDSHDGPFR